MERFKNLNSPPNSTPPSPTIISSTLINDNGNNNLSNSNYYGSSIGFNNNFLKKSKKTWYEKNRKWIELFLPPHFKAPQVYRRCCILLVECLFYILGYLFLLVFLNKFYPIFICAIVSLIIIYAISTRTTKYKLISLVYIIVQSILNFSFFFYINNHYDNDNGGNMVTSMEYNFIFLLNLLLSLISITIFFPKFLYCLSLVIILNLLNIIIHIISYFSFNIERLMMIQNLIVPFIISLLLLFYSYTLSIDNKDIKEKEKRFRHLFNTSSEGLIIHKNGLIIDANSTFEKIFQVKTQDVLTGYCSIWEFLPALESLFDPDNIDYNFNKKNLKSKSKISKQQQQQFQNQSVESSANSTPRNNNNNNVNSNNNNLLNVIIGNGIVGHNIINRASRSNTGLSDSGSSLFEESDSVDFFSPSKNQNKSPIVFDTVGIMPCGSEFTAQVKIDRKKINQQQQIPSPLPGQSSLLQVLPQQQQFNNNQLRTNNNNGSGGGKSNCIQSQYRSYSKNDFDVMSIVDVSARKKLIIADQALRRAEELNQAKINFLTTVSHEVRTPINGILASVEILDGSHLDTTQRDFLTCIKDSADYLLDLITDILDFSKIEAGKMELERIEFNLITMLEESINIVYRIAQEKKIDVLTIIDPDVPIILMGDPYRVKQIILNFLSNAIKFTTLGQVKVVVSGSLITNTSDPTTSSLPIHGNHQNHTSAGLNYKLIFSVEDSGVGIKEELIDLLFTPFYQLDGTNRNLGTGLGLSISKKLTALMGGDVGVKSVYGSGSTFSFSSLLSTSTVTPITLKSLSCQLSQSLIKLINNSNGGNGNFELSKINGFIFDDNIQSSNSISNFLNLLDINLKIVENQKNLKSDLSSFLNQLSTSSGNNTRMDGNLNLIITTKLSNENLNYFKEKLNSIINGNNGNNNNNTIYWFLLTENGLQTVDSFYSGIIKKPCNITSLVENVFKIFNCTIPIELYQLLTNRTKDDYKNYLRQKKDTPFKKLNLSSIGPQPPSPLLIQEQSQKEYQQLPQPKEINDNNTRVKELVRNSSDHIAITRGMIQENRSPRMSTPPLLFNLKGKGHSTNNLSNGSIDFEPINIGGSSSGISSSGSNFSNSNNSIGNNINNSAISISIGSFTPRSNISSPPSLIHSIPLTSNNNHISNSNNTVGLDKENNNVCCQPTSSLPLIKITNNKPIKTTRPSFIPPLDITSTATIAIPISNGNFGNNFVVDISSLLQDKTNDENNLVFDSISDNNINNSCNNNNNNTISPNNRSLNNSNAITPPVTPHKRNALIVDDTELNRKVLAQLLRKLEWKVSFASDGFEALKEIYEERCFDIVFMDYSMPILDGFETTKLIRQKEIENGWKRLNVVALSADSSSSFGQQCFNAGMDDYMGKPITLLTLKNTLNKWGGYNN